MPAQESYEPHEPSPIGSRLRIAIFVLSVVALLPTLRPEGPNSYRPGGFQLERDEGTVLYDSLRWARGEIVYRDFFTFQTPGFYALHALAFAPMREPTIESARLVQVALASLGTLLLALIVARLAGRAAGLAAAAVHVTLLFAIWPIPYPHWLAETFALGGVLACCEPRFGPRRAAWAGASFALCLATIQSLGTPLLAAGAVAVASLVWGTGAKRVARALAAYLAGAAIAVLPLVAYLAAHGALDDLVYCAWVWPFERYAAGNSDAMFYAADVAIHLREQDDLPAGLAQLSKVGLHAIWVLPLLALAMGVRASLGVVLQGVRARPASRAVVACLLSAAAVTPLFSEKTRADVVPLGFVGSFGLIAWASLSSREARRRVGLRAFVVSAAAVSLAALTTVAFTWRTVDALAISQGSMREHVRAAAEREGNTRGMWQWVSRHARADDTIAVGPNPGFLYLHLRRSAVPFTLLPLDANDDYLTREQWQWMARTIVEREPIALGIGAYPWRRLTIARPELRSRYRPEQGFLVRVER